LQLTPHVVPSHVAEPFIGTAHGEQDAPQFATALFATHIDPHAW
jgi:hypothetical protein